MKRFYLLFGAFISVVCVLLFITYGNIFSLFYQQDEWLTLGKILSGGLKSYFDQYSFFQLFTGTGRPLSLIFQYPLYAFFPYETWPFAVFSIVFHGVNTVLVGLFAYVLSKKFFYGVLASIFFLSCSTSSQAVTWFASNTQALPSTTFLLVSLIIALKAGHKKNIFLFIVAQVSAIVSFLFKESGAMAFIFVPFLYYWWPKNKTPTRNVIFQIGPLIFYGLLVLVSNIYRITTALPTEATAFVSNSPSLWMKMFLHALLYPIISLSQLFIPQHIMFSLAKNFQAINYGHINGFTESQLGVETIVTDVVSLYVSLVIIFFCLLLMYKIGNIRKIMTFSLAFTALNFLPFIILEKGNSYLDSRYFYVSTVGAGLLVSAIFYAVKSLFEKKGRFISYFSVVVMALCFTGLIWKHTQYIQRDIQSSVISSRERKNFFSQLNSLVPSLPNKVVMYITGNNFGYYGNPDLKIPMQQGPGYTFMTWYYRGGTIPKELIDSDFLWNIHAQGYREVGDRGFGYFWDKQKLIEAIRKHEIKPEYVVALFYDGDEKKLRNDSGLIQSELRQYY